MGQIKSKSGATTYLGTTSSVLGSTACNELCVVVLDQVVVKAEVLLLGEDSVVGLETVLLQELLISATCQFQLIMSLICQLSALCIVGLRPNVPTVPLVVQSTPAPRKNICATYPTPWMSRSGFSKQRSSKFPLAAIVLSLRRGCDEKVV